MQEIQNIANELLPFLPFSVVNDKDDEKDGNYDHGDSNDDMIGGDQHQTTQPQPLHAPQVEHHRRHLPTLLVVFLLSAESAPFNE